MISICCGIGLASVAVRADFDPSKLELYCRQLNYSLLPGFAEFYKQLSDQTVDSGKACPAPLAQPVVDAEPVGKKILKSSEPKSSKELRLWRGSLSPLWAQEYVGADLVRREIIILRDRLSLPPLPLLVADSPEGDHAKLVESLIQNDTSPTAILPAIPSRYVHVNRFRLWGSNHKEMLEETKKSGIVPRFVSNSMTWEKSTTIYDVVKEYHRLGTIWITGAGNRGDEAVDIIKTRAQADGIAIVIGSMNPLGMASDFSQPGAAVSVLAPSDHYIQSTGTDGKIAEFGGTSGAQPIASGALIAFEITSGYKLSLAEADRLLRATSIPTLHSLEKPKVHGDGLLNSYKIFRVGKRIEEKCRAENGEAAKECKQRELAKAGAFDFSVADLDEALAHADEIFPTCASSGRIVAQKALYSCDDKAFAFTQLRMQAHLHPRDLRAWKMLSCLHAQMGLHANAAHYGLVAGLVGNTLPQEWAEGVARAFVPDIQQQLARFQSQKILGEKNGAAWDRALLLAQVRYGTQAFEAPHILSILKRGCISDPECDKELDAWARRTAGEEYWERNPSLWKDPALVALHSRWVLSSSPDLNRRAFQMWAPPPDDKSRKAVLRALGILDLDGKKKLFASLTSNSDWAADAGFFEAVLHDADDDAKLLLLNASKLDIRESFQRWFSRPKRKDQEKTAARIHWNHPGTAMEFSIRHRALADSLNIEIAKGYWEKFCYQARLGESTAVTAYLRSALAKPPRPQVAPTVETCLRSIQNKSRNSGSSGERILQSISRDD